MLQITWKPGPGSDHEVTLEGRIVGQWVDVLMSECDTLLSRGGSVTLDLAQVIYADSRALRWLAVQPAERVRIQNCPALIKEMLGGRSSGSM